MLIPFLKAKIHNAAVTKSELDYEGSISIDENIINQAGLQEFEKVLVVNKNNGARFETYIIKAPAGSKEFGINGAAARLAMVGDKIIIFSFALFSPEELKNHKPKILIYSQETDSFIEKK
ncbi:MAG TPA: aspartate 1-decarboxylase [bacterium]|nr:aspartate 1-decarboxylase [bacterium]HPP87693.1 aspartate 1-decarboxylase [bacterium]